MTGIKLISAERQRQQQLQIGLNGWVKVIGESESNDFNPPRPDYFSMENLNISSVTGTCKITFEVGIQAPQHLHPLFTAEADKLDINILIVAGALIAAEIDRLLAETPL